MKRICFALLCALSFPLLRVHAQTAAGTIFYSGGSLPSAGSMSGQTIIVRNSDSAGNAGTSPYVFSSNGTSWSGTPIGGSGSYVGPDKNAKSDFGCTGNGVADDTTCLQNAINATQGDNGNLYLPPGKYKITSTITISNPITIHGNMGTVCTDSTPWCGSQIYYTGVGTAIHVFTAGGGTVHRVYFRDLTISSSGGQGVAAIGVNLDNVEESGFERVNIGDYGGSGAEKKGFTAAIATNHWAIGWILNGNFEDDQYVVDVEGGFYAGILIQNNDFYRDVALIRADGGSSNLNIVNNWFEDVRYIVYADSANARLQGAVIQGNHVNDDSGGDSTLTAAKVIEVTNSGGFLTSFYVAGNNFNLSGASSFFDLASSGDHFALIGNLMSGPSVVFSGAGSVTVGTLANNMPSTLGTNATRLTQ